MSFSSIRVNALKTLLSNIEESYSIVEILPCEAGTGAHSDEVDKMAQWRKSYDDAAASVAHASTKFSLGIMPIHTKDAAVSICKQLETPCMSLTQSCVGLYAYITSLCYRRELLSITKKIISSVKILVTKIIEDIHDVDHTDYKPPAPLTGKIWSLCEDAEKLPRSERLFYLRLIFQTFTTLRDTADEFAEELEENDDSDVGGWGSFDESDEEPMSEKERVITSAVVQLVRMSQRLVRRVYQLVKVTGNTCQPYSIAAIDVAVGQLKDLINSVTDLGMCLYRPLNIPGIVSFSSEVVKVAIHVGECFLVEGKTKICDKSADGDCPDSLSSHLTKLSITADDITNDSSTNEKINTERKELLIRIHALQEAATHVQKVI